MTIACGHACPRATESTGSENLSIPNAGQSVPLIAPPTDAAANVVVVAAPAAAAAAVHEPAGGVQGHVLAVQHRVQELMRGEDSEEEEEVQEEVQEGQEEVQEDLRPLRSFA